MDEQSEEFLAHYGVKGMRWGKRGKNPNYGDQQVKRDQQVYGSRGAKRINRSLNDGNQISVARGDEKTRRDRATSKNKYVRQGGKIGGAAVGAIAANVALTNIGRAARTSVGRNISAKIMGNSDAAALVSMATSNPAVRFTASVGAAKVASMFAGDAAVSVNMRARGYDPTRKY